MFCAGEFTDNQYTIEGTSLHSRVHTLGEGHREETWQIRAIWLKSERYQLIGKADLIEESNGRFYPVEYKRGRKGEWDNDEIQVTAQALCLEDMTGEKVTQGYLYYAVRWLVAGQEKSNCYNFYESLLGIETNISRREKKRSTRLQFLRIPIRD